MKRFARGGAGGIVLPFVTFTLIWGSTWLVIRGQLGVVAPQWSVTYRFVLAALAMFAVARVTGNRLRIELRQLPLLLAIGLCQFCLNFNAVYLAEQHITSGLVATVFALLLIPNSLLAWAFLGQKPSARFRYCAGIAIAGIVLLFSQELERGAATTEDIIVGIGLTLVGLLGASAANVMQAREAARQVPLMTLLAWTMAIGAAADAGIALAVAGPPTFDPSPAYIAGLAYLAFAASALAFSLYFPVVRRIGPGKAAYSSALVPIVAMALSTLFEHYSWTPIAAAGATLAIGGMLLALWSGRIVVPAPACD